jgi:hypothetical protein
MTTAAYHHPSRREILSELEDRLKRVDAAGQTVASLAGASGTPSTMLGDAIASLERDLTLALREAEAARERIIR